MIPALMRAEVRQLLRAPVSLGSALLVAATPVWLLSWFHPDAPGAGLIRGMGAFCAFALGSLLGGRAATPDRAPLPGEAHPALPVSRAQRVVARTLLGLSWMVGMGVVLGWFWAGWVSEHSPARDEIPGAPSLGALALLALWWLPFLAGGAAGGVGTTLPRLAGIVGLAAAGVALDADQRLLPALAFAVVATPLLTRGGPVTARPGEIRVIRLPGPRGLPWMLARKGIADLGVALALTGGTLVVVRLVLTLLGMDPTHMALELPPVLAALVLLARPTLPGTGAAPLPDALFRLPVSRARLTLGALGLGALRVALALGLVRLLQGQPMAPAVLGAVAATGALVAAGDLSPRTYAGARVVAALLLLPLLTPHAGIAQGLAAGVGLLGAAALAFRSLGLGRRRTLRALG